MTADADDTPARDIPNLERLAATLRGYAAALRDILRSRGVAGRPQDRREVALLREVPRKRPPQ